MEFKNTKIKGIETKKVFVSVNDKQNASRGYKAVNCKPNGVAKTLGLIVFCLMVVILFCFIEKAISIKAENLSETILLGDLKDKPEFKSEPMGDTGDEILKELTTEEIIRKLAKENDINADNLVKLAFCESSLNPKAFNSKDPFGGSKGLFQINGVHKVSEICTYDVECSTNWAIKKIKQGKSKIWTCSRLLKLNF